MIDMSLLLGFLIGFMFIGNAGGGPTLGFFAIVGCNLVCGAAVAACVGASAGVTAAFLSNPITAPFASLLTPLFMKGCGAGYAGCMAACVGGAFVAPSP